MAKVVHLTSVHPPLDTRIFQKECRGLARAGFEVVLIAPNSKMEEVVDGVTIRGLSKPKTRVERMTLTLWKVLVAALREDAVLYHMHDPELLPVGQILRLLGKRVVFDMHEDLPKSILSKQWIAKPLRKLLSKSIRGLEKALLYNIPVIFAEFSYRRDYPQIKNFTEILNYPIVDDLLTITSIRNKEPSVGYIGSVCKERGSIGTIMALTILKERGKAVPFECVGHLRGGHDAELRKLAEQCGLDSVNFYGFLPPQIGWEIISKTHIGLAVLEPTPNYVESFPTKMFEYMALGIPVIVSNFPLYNKVIADADCGISIDPLDYTALANAIEYLLDHPIEAKEMGNRGRLAVLEKYNWNTEERKLIDFYNKLLA